MFGFLKKKLKSVVDRFSSEAEKSAGPEKSVIKEKKPNAAAEEIRPAEEKKEAEEAKPEKKSFAKRLTEKLTKVTVSEEKFDELFWDMEVALLENNVAVEVIDRIKSNLKKQLAGRPISKSGVKETIKQSLKDSIEELFIVKKIDLLEKVKEKKPFVILFVGINGSGKTTTIAKTAKLLQDNGFSCVMAAADTFRAAAIQQLEKHADILKVRLIKHDYGSDPAAVAFDAIKYAGAKNIDAVLIDTAGRLHSNTNLVEEMKKIVRVSKPDLKIFVGESITGNDCVEQAKKFNEAIGIDGIILAKADIDERGGAAISISHVTQKPILFLGTGQKYSDLKPFDPDMIVGSLGLG